ncbi:MAG: hypothetical protein JWR01_960 [Subtercola sp.]|nr:hypothetical protein [Subtercola sp.]
MAKRSRGRTPWIIAGLIVFVLADLALVAFALSGPSMDGDSVGAAEPTFVATPAPTTDAPAPTTPAPTPSATSTAPSTAAPSTPVPSASAAATLSGMADAKVGYRATAGTCTGSSTSTDSVIELTTDGGATWTNVNPTDLRIRSVEKLIVVDDSHVDLLATYGASCTESAISTFTQGEFWQAYPDRTAALK